MGVDNRGQHQWARHDDSIATMLGQAFQQGHPAIKTATHKYNFRDWTQTNLAKK